MPREKRPHFWEVMLNAKRKETGGLSAAFGLYTIPVYASDFSLR